MNQETLQLESRFAAPRVSKTAAHSSCSAGHLSSLGLQVQSEASKTLVMPYKLIAGLAATGAAITGYLTVVRK